MELSEDRRRKLASRLGELILRQLPIDTHGRDENASQSDTRG